MKNGKRPTRNHKKIMQKEGLDPSEWLVSKVNHEVLILVSRDGEKKRALRY